MNNQEGTQIGDDIEAELQAQVDVEAEAPKKKAALRKKNPKADYVKVVLEENDEIPPSGLFIGVNDRAYLLQPGMEAEVPLGVIDVLENAVMATPRIDPQTRRVVGYKERLRYPFRRL